MYIANVIYVCADSKLYMKRIHQIVFLLAALLCINKVDVYAFDGIATAHQNTHSLERVIEEEREVCDFIYSVYDDEVEISGGNPSLQSKVIIQSRDQILGDLVCKIYINVFANHPNPHLGEVPFYLRYLSLKLHC